MNKRFSYRLVVLLLAVLMTMSSFGLTAYASEVTDDPVQAVITQLQAIDTLEQMQAKRYTYTVSKHYDVNTTNEAIITAHMEVRAAYESYVAQMFSARAAAQQAYDALSPDQQAQIDASLVAKLGTYLPNVFNAKTVTVTPGEDEYTFETVNGGTGYAYEVSNYMVSGQIPQTFILVDTSDGKTSWTPNGLYAYGQSNYEVAYCCDVETGLVYSTDYKRTNLEDSGYYGPVAAQHIRAILLNSYPYVSMEAMKANLKAGGMSSSFVDSLTRADMIAATQMAVWSYANAADGAAGGLSYYASIDVTKNQGTYFTALHDYTNEIWEWLPNKGYRSYDARAAYRVNNLAYYLCTLPGVEAAENQIVISDVKITRAELIGGTGDTYNVGMYIYLNNGGDENDDLTVTVTSFSGDTPDPANITDQCIQMVGQQTTLMASVKANEGDTIQVVVEGTQTLGKGVYFYEPRGGRDASQSLVGVAEGETKVYAEELFVFEDELGDMGLRIYKTEEDTGFPLSEITFSIYHVALGEGETIGDVPTAEEIARYATAENLAGSVVTDATGYAEITLEPGVYLVVEEHNADKVVAPIQPFYITLPMETAFADEDGTVSVETLNIVAVYPKNVPVTPPEEPPVVPPTPDDVSGSFRIYKHAENDEAKGLPGAQFAVYRPVTAGESGTEILYCDGVQYAVVPVTVDGEKLILTTGADGYASSPALSSGTYFLKEIKAPDGYYLRGEAIAVVAMPDTMTTTSLVKIPNRSGDVLPETGGSGVLCMWLAGSLLLAAAGVLLVTRKRVQA